MSNAKEFHCGVCDITCTGKAPFEQHLASAKHLKKAKTNGNESSRASPTTPLSPSESVSLSIPSSPSTTLSAETMKILLEWNHPRGYLPFCDICQLPLHGGNNADTHFAETNQIHQQKLNNLQQIKENDPEYFCKMCAEIFPEEKSVIIHLNSESHAETKQRKASLEKFIKTYKTFQELKKAREETILAENQLENQFSQLQVVDVSESDRKPRQEPLFSLAAFQNAMERITSCHDDD